MMRVIRRSSVVPEGIAEESRTIAGRLGCRRAVPVRLTSDVLTPCLAGVVRPFCCCQSVNAMPRGPTTCGRSSRHELAHARNRDLAWNLAAHVASIVLWFHPLAWRIRAAHVAACDAVCDAIAADLLGDAVSYGRTLARLALRSAWPMSVHGLAMARMSDVRQRLDALNRKVFRASLSRRRVMPALFVVGVLVVLIGGFGFTRAEQAPSTATAGDSNTPVDQKLPGRLTLRAVAADTGQPIEGVSITYRRNRPDGTNEKGTVTTGKDGVATIDYPPDFKPGYFEITAKKPKLVPVHVFWDD